jgi:Ser/Thr protein kinase RdoA (MazF antagonist)
VQNIVQRISIKGKNKIIRFTPSTSRSFDEVRAEIDWISYLVENNIPAAAPISSSSGNLVERLTVEDRYFSVCVFEHAKGDFATFHDGRTWKTSLIQKWGAIMGKMHALAKQYNPRVSNAKRMEWPWDKSIKEARQYVPNEYKQVITDIEEVVQRIKQHPKNPDTYGLIHNDLNPTNIFTHNDEITIFDFDDCAYNYFIHDIAVTIPQYANFMQQSHWQKPLNGFFSNFMKGYLKENIIPDYTYTHINDHLRAINLGGVVFSFEIDEKNRKLYNDYFQTVLDRYKNKHPIFNLDFRTLI